MPPSDHHSPMTPILCPTLERTQSHQLFIHTQQIDTVQRGNQCTNMLRCNAFLFVVAHTVVLSGVRTPPHRLNESASRYHGTLYGGRVDKVEMLRTLGMLLPLQFVHVRYRTNTSRKSRNSIAVVAWVWFEGNRSKSSAGAGPNASSAACSSSTVRNPCPSSPGKPRSAERFAAGETWSRATPSSMRRASMRILPSSSDKQAPSQAGNHAAK